MKRHPLFIEGKLNAGKCKDCGYIRFPRMDYCNKCQSTNISDYLVGPKGKLMSYTISFSKPMVGGLKPPYPYAVARFDTENENHIDVFGAILSKEPFDDIEINRDVTLVSDKLLVKFKMGSD